MTVDELIQALDRAEGEEVDHMDWPYIDTSIEIIDGGLRPLLTWLLKHYEVTPRA